MTTAAEPRPDLGTGATAAAATDTSVAADDDGERRYRRIAVVTLLAVTLALIAAGLILDDGHFVYVFDDTAIHMSMANQLLHHGTWGVTAGHYTSASSAPGWTLLVTGGTAMMPFLATYVPLLLDLLAALWVIHLVGRHQTFLRPGRHDLVAGGFVVLLVAVVWFLPGLVLTGMEHVLQTALLLVALVLTERLTSGDTDRRTVVLAALTMLAAGTIRFETLFVAAGVVLALGAAALDRLGPRTLTRARAARLAAVLTGAALLPVVITGAVNLAFGDSFLPNSIIAKTGQGRALKYARSPFAALEKTVSDPLLFALVGAAVLYLAWAWWRPSDRPARNVTVTLVFATTAVLHAFCAEFGWFERYQAYLVIAGTFVLFRIAGERCTGAARRHALICMLVLLPVLGMGKAILLAEAPIGMSNTYRQRFQLARFLDRYYDGKGFVTGELGYTTLEHDGPVVDVLGLGTHAIAVQRQRGVETVDAGTVRRLARDADAQVMAFYARNPGFEIPKSWRLVAQWDLDEPEITIPDPVVAFYAPTKASAKVLDRNLHRFQSQLPSRVHTTYAAELRREFLDQLGRNGSG